MPATRSRFAALVPLCYAWDPLAGSPLKRQRKAGVRDAGRSVIAFPYMPRVADLPPGWRHFSAAQKIEHLIGLGRCYEILSWGPIAELDPMRRSMRMQVLRVIMPIGIKALLDGRLGRDAARERDRQRVLDELARCLGKKEAPRPTHSLVRVNAGDWGGRGRFYRPPSETAARFG